MKSTSRALFLLWGMNALILVLLAPQWWQGLLVGVVISVAAWKLASARATPSQHTSDDANVAAGGIRQELPDLVQCIVPAWGNNVQLARSQTQEAIDNLTRRFVGIHQRLGGALSMAAGGKNADVLQVIQNAAVQLGGIAEALEQVLSTRDALLRNIDTLREHNDEIRELAQEVNQIAGRTGVADLISDHESWTELATRSSEAGRRIVSKTKAVQLQIQTALVSATQLDADAGRMIDDSRMVIDSVIADFRQSALKLSGTVSQLEEENREVDQEVCDILVNLQFQDRISQILDHVQRDMNKLAGMLHNGEPLPKRTQWLTELEKTYTTVEQRQIHAGQQTNRPTQSQVDFF